MQLNSLILFLLISIGRLNAADNASIGSTVSSIDTLDWDEASNLSSTTELHVIRQVLQKKFKKQNLKRNFELALICTESQKNRTGGAREKRSFLKKTKATFVPAGIADGLDLDEFEQEQLESDASDHSNRLELKQNIKIPPKFLEKFTKYYTGAAFFNVYGVPGLTKTSNRSLFFGKEITHHPKNITCGLPKADRIEIKCELKEGSAITADKFTYQAANCCPHNNCCNCYCVKTTTEVDGSRSTKCFPMCSSLCLYASKNDMWARWRPMGYNG